MTKLVVVGEKLSFIRYNNQMIFPFTYQVNIDSQEITISDISSNRSFTDSFENFVDSTEANYESIDVLTLFLSGYVGFKTASGGSGASLDSANLIRTGQFASFIIGDDGDNPRGREFYILSSNNPFGNNFRFTDDLGGQDYTNDIVVDWSTYDGTNVLCYKKTPTTGTLSWDELITTINGLTIAGFTNWRLWNLKEMFNLMDYSLDYVFEYAPFGIGETYFYTSTTYERDTNQAWFSYANYGWVQPTIKSQTFGGIAVRYFTLNELGL